MKVVIAIDSLKGSLSSLEAGSAIRTGLLRAIPEAEAVVKPVADGGEGTTQALVDALGGTLVELEVTGPYGEPVRASYGYIAESGTAVMEMAAAAGITLSPRREPLYATTYGVGEMIRDAAGRGCRRFLIGIGGSATNDGGVGMLTALGVRFLDGEDRPCPVTAEALERVARVDCTGLMPELAQCSFRIACDVNNPLCGPTGSTYVFGPQKGVGEELRPRLDAAMNRYADQTARVLGRDCRQAPGAGAAGGLGFAFMSYLGGELISGVDLVLTALALDDCVRDADFVVTGEGCLDEQTAYGKTPAGVAACAARHGVPVIALAGSVRPGAEVCNARGIHAYFSILPGVMTLEAAMEKETARRNMENAAEQVFRLVAACRS